MKIIIVHGDDTEKSYQRLMLFYESARKRNWDIKSIDETDVSVSEAISSISLFNEERFFIIKDVRLIKQKDIKWINEHVDLLNINLVIYSNKVLPVTFIKKFEKVHKVEEYKLPKILYKFLDNLTPGNAHNAIALFQDLKSSDAPELVFSVIAKHFKDLYWVKVDEGSMNYPSWRTGKLKTLANKFQEEKLKVIIGDLSRIDVQSKTGQADLFDELDLLIATKLD